MEKVKVKKVNQDNRYLSQAQMKAESVIMPPDKNDPNGSYTGKPINGGVPVQDADDL